MSVGGVCGLAAAGLASFVPTTRLVFSMANDNLICGKYLKHIYGKAGSPRVAVLFVLAIQLCLQLMVDEMYVKVVFQITIFCELIRMVIGNVVVYVDVFTGQAIEVGLGEARNVSYHSIQNESLISKTTYSTDGETSSEDELDEMLRRDICKHTTYGSLSTNHNCFLDPCVIEKCSKSCHLYEPSSPHINLQTFPISPKIVKRTVTNKEANIWLGIFVVATTVATSIFSQIEFDHFKSLTIYLSVILLTLLTAATFGILYVVLSIFFVDTKDELNGGGEEGLSSSQLVLRLVGIFLLIQCIFLFDIKVFGIVGVWGVVGIGYYFVNLSTYCT
uniref:Aa_trans domain-containing protein n=1 Tax=Rhabditophanes sp. KR3021 TaxID=114890 RepID=A0AC35TYE3_9BILA